uniref:Mothers against decapentaplegic homolog n=1 Tax=Romanomermis culicivorax TaxID=13658 RepID=A0A915KM83_ROMCU
MNELKNAFRPNKQSSSIITRLSNLAKMEWKQGDEEDQWANRAVESLLKKLKEEGQQEYQCQVSNLEQALLYPNQASECVTIKRSLDGRWQINHRKGIPHVICCRVWRWPDLQNHHELKSAPNCKYPYTNKQDKICVNPYHYCRVQMEDKCFFPPTVVPRIPEFPRSRLAKFQPNNWMHWLKQQRNGNANVTGQPTAMLPAAASILPPTLHQMPSMYPGGAAPPSSLGSASPAHFATPPPPSASSVMHSSLPGSPFSYFSDDDKMQVDDFHMRHQQQQMLALQQHIHFQQNGNMDVDMGAVRSPPIILQNQYFPDRSMCPEPENWCAISYYELNSRVGEMFNVPRRKNTVTIDGFTDPTENRFCLGRFNNVTRSINVQKTRDSIGKGIRLTNDEGKIYVECLSDYSVFVQSLNCNAFRGFHPKTICKIPPKMSLKIFDMEQFKQMLVQAIQMSGENKEKVFEMEKMCLIRMSFVRGWGSEYQRQDVTSTPCWIEVRLNHPLQWYNTAIVQSGLCMQVMSSMT